MKALFGLPLRETTGLVASLPKLAGLDWAVPDFSTLSRRQKGLNVAIPYWPSTGALNLLIDSTGIKAEGEGEWFAKKHGPSKSRQWRKVHLGIDADTLEIRAIEVTGSRVGDACAFRGIGAVISRDRGRLFHGIAGSHFAVAGRLFDRSIESGLKAWVKGFRGFSAHAFA